MTEYKTLKSVLNKQVKIDDSFWTPYIELVRNTVIPYQWEALNDRIEGADKSYAVQNFKIAAGLAEGEFGGMVFQDSDVAKWLEAVAYSLETKENKELEKIADEMIDIIEKAQQPNGYLNTYFTIKEPDKKWTNLFECHELYCAGHMIEAATAYYQATGKRKLLDIMIKFVDHINDVFGPEENKIKGYPGHQVIEMALVKLYDITGDEKHLKLSKFFIDERGKEPNFFNKEWETTREKLTHYGHRRVGPPHLPYNQAHLPVREQKVAVGHSVRAVYMYAGMADVAIKTKDESLLNACKTLWNNIIRKQMYITGGIGSTNIGEAFTFDYDLPNDNVYAETCASIGLIFFAQRMLQLEADSQYADIIEKELYNIVLSSMSEDGRHYFYVNPLEVWPKASELDPGKNHVKAVRQKWFGCACCPPNVARLLASLGQYIYSVNEDTIYVHQFIGGESNISVNEKNLTMIQETNYPYHGDINFTLKDIETSSFKLALRIPNWCKEYCLEINGKKISKDHLKVEKRYLFIDRNWKNEDQIKLTLIMEPELIEANPYVRSDAGKVSIARGPLVYCLEEIDNGENLSAISIPYNSKLSYREDIIEGMGVIEGIGYRTKMDEWNENLLYRKAQKSEEEIRFIAVPYYLWGNRKPGEMQVWTRTK